MFGAASVVSADGKKITTVVSEKEVKSLVSTVAFSQNTDTLILGCDKLYVFKLV